MCEINSNYLKLPGSYLFAGIKRRVDAYREAHPDAKIISLGIGDVTRPLVPAVIEAMPPSMKWPTPRPSAAMVRNKGTIF